MIDEPKDEDEVVEDLEAPATASEDVVGGRPKCTTACEGTTCAQTSVGQCVPKVTYIVREMDVGME